MKTSHLLATRERTPSRPSAAAIAGLGANDRRRVAVTAFLLALLAAVGFQAAPAAAAVNGFTGVGVTNDGQGYLLVGDKGETYAFGTVRYRPNNPSGFGGTIADAAVTADGQGYVEVSTAGQVYAYGTVAYRGNATGFTGSITGVAVTDDGQGYALVSSAGQVYAFGTAAYRGNADGFSGGMQAISLTGNGQGYAMVSGAGQVYAYGTAVYRGNASGFSGTVSGISLTADGQGYALVSTAGQVYAYGTVGWRGNASGFTNGIQGVAVTGDGAGYLLMSGLGQAYAYGTVVHRGNADPTVVAPAGVGGTVAAIAKAQPGDSSRNHEFPAGSNCNFYTTALGAGSTSGCTSGYRGEAWCADFARWVWGQAGARTTNLTAGAISFRAVSTWRDGGGWSAAQVGDAIGFNYGTPSTGDDHVGLVVAKNSNGTVTMVSGNASNSVRYDTFVPGSGTPYGTVSGYASPVR